MLCLKNQKLHDDLIDKGVVPNKTHICTYPEFLLDVLTSHFVRGLLDGDGCIHSISEKYPKNRAVDICGNPNFCERLKEMISLYVDSHFSLINVDKKLNKSTMRISTSGSANCIKFLDWIYKDADMYLERKYKLYQQYLATA